MLVILGPCYLFNVFNTAANTMIYIIMFIALLVGLFGAWVFYKFETLTVMAACKQTPI